MNSPAIESNDLFPVKRRRKRTQRVAEVFIDNVSLGHVLNPAQITQRMRVHGITLKDLDLIWSGKRQVRTFRCNGQVRITVVESAASLANILAA